MSETAEAVLKVSEIFKSIQGESSFAGYPTIFIRLQGCNLKCLYCDTKHAQDLSDKNQYKEMEILDVVEEIVNMTPTGFICITGGEPLLQMESIRELLTHRYDYLAYQTFTIETNGSIQLDKHLAAQYIMDWKCPSAFFTKEQFQSYERKVLMNLDVIKSRRAFGLHDEIKFVIADEKDYSYAQSCIRQVCKYATLSGDLPTIHYSPVVMGDKDWKEHIQWLAEKMRDDITPAKLQLQLHKIIWPDVERGV